MTAVAKATAETEAVLKEYSAEEIDTDDGSGETMEVCLTAVAKETAETGAFLKLDVQRKKIHMMGLVKQRRLI